MQLLPWQRPGQKCARILPTLLQAASEGAATGPQRCKEFGHPIAVKHLAGRAWCCHRCELTCNDTPRHGRLSALSGDSPPARSQEGSSRRRCLQAAAARRRAWQKSGAPLKSLVPSHAKATSASSERMQHLASDAMHSSPAFWSWPRALWRTAQSGCLPWRMHLGQNRALSEVWCEPI